ncbi:MAG: hypothetical protein HY689_10540 [Chloroflexi bacterium]|nr:hypothetical protein [Chloroflexota bacterium]
MQQRRVVLVGDDNLLATGIALLLQAQPEIGVIIAPILDAAASLALVAHVLRDNAGITVIAVSLDGPDMNVYWAASVRQASPTELLSAIYDSQAAWSSTAQGEGPMA